MKDTIIKGTGDSRYLKSAIPENITHAQLVQMLRNGTFPIDLNGINEAGIEQLGTPLNTATLLSDETAEEIGIEKDNPTVDDALGKLKNALMQKPPVKVSVPEGTTLENATWAQIEEVANAGYAPKYWSVGDTKTVSIGGTNYTFRIIGFAHDDLTAPTGVAKKAAITFEMENCYGTTYKMNSTNTNVGGWGASEIRTTHLPAIYALLPADLQSVIKDVNKPANEGNASSNIVTTSDNLFLLSAAEILQSVEEASADEGTQYDYYLRGGSAAKSPEWWTRSPFVTRNTGWVTISTSGKEANSVANTARGLSFAFCVGESDVITPLSAPPITDAFGNPITIPGEQIVGAGNAKVATGTYKGTGKYGESNPSTLTFDFEPKMVIITVITQSDGETAQESFDIGSSGKSQWLMWIDGVKESYTTAQNRFTKITNGISWYCTGNQSYMQCNGSSYYYSYIAIG